MSKQGVEWMVFCVLGTFLCGCVPPVYVYDRLSTMEQNASGDYPLLREEMLENSEAVGPLMLDPKQSQAYQEEKEKIFRIVNGEFVSSKSAEPSTPAAKP